MSDPQESETSPYEAPSASLESGAGVISAKARHYLISSRWWMIMVSAALMVNGTLLVAMVFYMLVVVKTVPFQMKLMIVLVMIAANLIFLPGLRLLQCVLALGRVKKDDAEKDMIHALHRHEEFWKFLGIAFLFVGGLFFYGYVFVVR